MRFGLLLWLTAAAVVFVAGNGVLKTYAQAPRPLVLVAALLMFTVGNLMMVRLMRESGMALALSLSAVMQLLLANALAMMVFGERPTATQLAGVALGATGVILMLLPGGKAQP